MQAALGNVPGLYLPRRPQQEFFVGSSIQFLLEGLDADRIQAELYFGCAEHDEWAPREMIDALERHLAAAGARYRVEWYPGTHHGFVFPNRGEIYRKAAAETHWSRLLALFQRNLH